MVLPAEENPTGIAFQKVETDLTNEAKAGRVVDSTKARFWKIKNPAKKHIYSGETSTPARSLLSRPCFPRARLAAPLTCC